MKTKSTILIIIGLVFFGSYAAIISYAQGPDDILNIAMILYFPSIVTQLMANEGNGIICVDACGPCSAWGYNYLLVNGECKIPDKVEDCYAISPPMEWKFVNNKCVPLAGVYNYNNTIPHDPEEFVNHSSQHVLFDSS